MTTLGRRVPKKPKPPAAGRKAASPESGGRPGGREPDAKTSSTVRTTVITAVASVIVALVGAAALAYPTYCGMKGWCDAGTGPSASASAGPSGPPSALPTRSAATASPLDDAPALTENRSDGVDAGAVPGGATRPTAQAAITTPAQPPRPVRTSGRRTVTQKIVVTSSVYIDVDSDKIPYQDKGTADDDFQIEPGTITRHGNARFAPQGDDRTCTVVAQVALSKPVGAGPFCGTSGDTLRPRRFILKFTEFTAAGDCELEVTYLD